MPIIDGRYEMPTVAQLIERQAKSLIRRVHPDVLDAYSYDASQVGRRLVPLLEKIIKRPEDMRNWGDDIRNNYFPKGSDSTIQIAGFAPDKQTVRPPITIPLKAPRIFIKMLHQYLDAGSISEQYLNAPPYDPNMVYGVDEEDDSDDSVGYERAEGDDSDARLAARDLLKNIEGAQDYDHLRSIHWATGISPEHNMRILGVFKALDKETEDVIAREIIASETPEQLKAAEDHVDDFPFDDAKCALDLRKLLVKKRESLLSPDLPPDPVYAPPNAVEASAAQARSLDALAEIMQSARVGHFPEDERRRTMKSINGFAKKILLEESGRDASLPKFSRILKDAQNFHFSDEAYGLDVVGVIQLRAKYFVLTHIWSSFSEKSLRTIDASLKDFPFTAHNIVDIKSEIDKRKRAIHAMISQKQRTG